MKIKCYLLTAKVEIKYFMPIYYKIIGTYSEMQDLCSILGEMGDETEIDNEREPTKEELENYTLRENQNFPLVYQSIRHFDE